MVYNIDEDNGRAREPGDGVLPGPGSGGGTGEHTPEAHPTAHGGRTGVNEGGVPTPEVHLTAEEERVARVFARWRGKFQDVPDEKFDQVVRDLQVPEPISAIARGLVEQGYCPHLHPTTVRINLTRFRDAMGWPRYADQAEEPEQGAKEDEADELIEGSPVMKRLGWLIRIQQARVRKALRFEGHMADMILPMASSEIKLLSDLLDKELEVAMKTGDLKTVPQAVTLEGTDIPVTDPAEAFRVVLAIRRLRTLLAANATTDKELNARTIDLSPATDGGGAAKHDGCVDDGGGDAVGTPLPGAAESGPVGPGPGADGEHGRT